MKPMDKFLEDVDDLATRVYDLPMPETARDRVAELLEEITAVLEDQDTLRSTDWDD